MFTKDRKGRIRGVKVFNPIPHITSHKLISMQPARLTVNQIESTRRVISKQIKRIGKYKIHIRPSVSVSSKPSEVRMGKGKGAIDYYICRVKSGQLLFTIDGVSIIVAKNTFLRAARKLPIKVKIISAL